MNTRRGTKRLLNLTRLGHVITGAAGERSARRDDGRQRWDWRDRSSFFLIFFFITYLFIFWKRIFSRVIDSACKTSRSLSGLSEQRRTRSHRRSRRRLQPGSLSLREKKVAVRVSLPVAFKAAPNRSTRSRRGRAVRSILILITRLIEILIIEDGGSNLARWDRGSLFFICKIPDLESE